MDKIWILTERWDNGSLILGIYRNEDRALAEMETEKGSNVAFSKPDKVTQVKRNGVSRIYGMGAVLSVEPYEVQT